MKAKYTNAISKTATKIGDDQLKPAASTGVASGQKHQKKDQRENSTAEALIGTPHLPRRKFDGGRVSGWWIRRQRTQPIERQ